MTTINKVKLLFTDLVHDITLEITLPLVFGLFIELISNLQVLSLSLLPLIDSIPTSQNTLSAAVNQIISYLEPFKIFNPFDSEVNVIIILTLCSLYFILYLAMIGYIAYERGEENQLKEILTKIASFITLIHSKIVFYFIHCFVMKAMKNQKGFCSNTNSMTCTAERIIIPAIIFTFNVIITIAQEIFCYQIHQNKHAYGIKNNLHNFVKFSHKFLVIILFCFLEDSAKILIVFSVFFNVCDLLVLHYRLPFFNLSMLRFSIACSTISAFCAIFTISRFWNNGENLCLIMIPILPVIVKLSISKLNQTLRNIFSFKFKTPYHAVHLPNLIEDYLQKNVIFPLPDKFNRSTIYSMGFLGQELERVIETTRKENTQIQTQETRKATYSKAIEIMTRTLQKYPQSEILLLSIAQIYSQILGDSFKALDVVNKISEKDQSFAGKISIKAISQDLAVSHQDMGPLGDQQEKRKNSHLSYFAYRHKIQILKRRIKGEIQDHLKLWKIFSSQELDIFSAITQASAISSHTRNTTSYWYKNFEGSEFLYVNASLMYGLYVEIVQAIPHGGTAFFKKAYNSIHTFRLFTDISVKVLSARKVQKKPKTSGEIGGPRPWRCRRESVNNKWHVWRDVIDVTVGSSAVIVASIEPDKIGKVVDASSSVKEMFKTSKQGLIGTNIAVVLPNFVAVKHNDLIRGYQKYFTGNIDHNISSYAKTLQDEYFKAQVTLHVSPLTHRGLNLVAYIRKLSEHQSLMIVDHKGHVIEYSKDLSLPLNLFMKRSYVKIESLCPDFKKINQAFAALYRNSNNNNDDALTTKRDEFEEETLLQSPKLNNPNHLDSILPPLSPTNQRLLSNSFMDNDPLNFKSFRSEVPLYDETPMIVHKNTTETIPGNNLPTMNQIEAQEVWDLYKDSKELTFHPHNQKGGAEIKYSAEIEPFFFDNKWYQIIKMKNPETYKPVSHQFIQPEPAILSVVDDFADDFPSVEERSEVEGGMTSSRKKSNRTQPTLKNIKYTKTQTLSLNKNPDSNTLRSSMTDVVNNGPGQINMKKFSHKAQSVVSSQASQKMTAKRLRDSLKIERQSTSSKLVLIMVYIAIIAIVCSVCIHLISTKNSLNKMQSSIILVQTVNSRLAKTIMNWQAMMVLYSRSVKLRPIDWRIPRYQQITINSSMAVLANAKELTEEADSFKSKDLITSLYAKTVKLYEPLDHTLFDSHSIDQFTANSVLIEYYLWVARYTGSYLDLVNNREFLFAMNNTVNDYLLTLDRSINDLAGFFDDTRNQNIYLISGVTTMEILFVLCPLALILIIFTVIIRTYSKLFQAICKINENSLTKRLKQLQDLSVLFEENLEDDISSFQKFKSQGLTIKSIGKKAASVTASRRCKIAGLAIYLSKYVLFAAALIFIIIALVVVTLNKSTQDLENLDSINDKAKTIYSLGSNVRMLVPAQFFTMIFWNNTSYKIRNDVPANQLLSELDTLADANNIVLNALSDSNNEITDPVIKDILDGNVCQYVTAEYYLNCIQDTKGSVFGLLGLQSLYTQITQTMRQFATTPNPTFALASTLSTQFGNAHNNAYMVLFDIYDYLTNYLVGTFIDAADENKTEIRAIFYRNLTAVLVAMFLIRVVVLTKLQVFDLGIRRILRIIPYRIIEENKVMSHYLARTFQDELRVMKQIG